MSGPIGTTRLPAQPCPNCGHRLDSATPIGKKIYTPKPNDYTVCLNCQQVLQFDTEMKLQKRRLSEVDERYKEDIARIIFTMKTELPRIKANLKAQRN